MINIDSIINTALDTKYQYGKSSGFPKWLSLDGTNDYGLQFPFLNGYGSFIKNDGTRNYIECRNGWVDAIGYNPPMNSKNIGMYKFVWMVEDYGVTRTFWSWNGYTTFTVNSTGKVEVEMQGGAGSMRVTSTNTVTVGDIVCCVIRINTNNNGGTRNVNDVDIWITSTKEIKGFFATGNNSSTGSYGVWGSYNTTPFSPWYGRLYRAVAWSGVTPSDAECSAEQASPWSEVYGVTPTFSLDADNVNNRCACSPYRRDAFIRGLYEKGSDSDGNYIEFWGTYDRNSLKGFASGIQTNSNLNLSQADSFMIKSKFKVIQFNTNNVMGVFGANFNFGMFFPGTTGVLQTGCCTGGTPTTINATTIALNTIYDVALEWNARDKKLYTWINGICVNPAGMSFTGTFSVSTNLCFGWSAILGGNESSGRIRMYHSRVMIGEFTDEEMVADYNLGNNLPNTDRLVLEWRPEGFKNEPLIYKESNLSGSGWSASSATVTPNYGTFADGITPTSRITSTAGTAFNVSRTVSSFGGIAVNGAWMAGRSFYWKVWIRTRPGASTSQKIRLTIFQVGVQDFILGDFTVNDGWTEVATTQTLNASTSATALQFRIVSATTLEAVDIEVGCTLAWVINEFCYDYSPDCRPSNIGRFTPYTISLNYKPGRDGTDVSNSEIALRIPRGQLHLRGSTNSIQRRTDPSAGARIQSYTLGSGFRSPVHITATRSIDPLTNFTELDLFVDGVPTTDNQNLKNLFVDSTLLTGIIQLGNNGSPYTMAKLWDIKILKGKAGQTEAQQLKNGITPNNMDLFARYGPGNSEAGNTLLLDQSENRRHIKLVNGAQIDYQQII